MNERKDNVREGNKVEEPRHQQNVVINQPVDEAKEKNGKPWLIGVLGILAIVILAGFMFFNNGGGESSVGVDPGQENVKEEQGDVKVDAPDVNIEAPDVDTEGIENSIQKGIEEGAESVRKIE